jgi:hypothetical protein
MTGGHGRRRRDFDFLHGSWVVHDRRPVRARWEQAFSEDSGQTWETNWVMVFGRAPG